MVTLQPTPDVVASMGVIARRLKRFEFQREQYMEIVRERKKAEL